LDVTSDESVTDAVRLVREHTDRLDVLINNAGAPGNGIGPADATVDEVQSVYDTNVYGPIRVTHAFLPLLRAADNPRVVMVSSGAASFTVVTDPEQPVSKFHELAYSSSKAALNMITVRYAQALPEIKFNIATPGEIANHKWAATDMNKHTRQLTVTEGTDSILYRSPWPRSVVTATRNLNSHAASLTITATRTRGRRRRRLHGRAVQGRAEHADRAVRQ
jgi:NAD(P)-dependent dehydrogenase (short-subunit alcohol dehydrogenase family)